MGYQTRHSVAGSGIWALAKRQHGVVARRQLLESGLHPQSIKHRVKVGRLHPVRRGVYAVGRVDLTREGRWMAAVLACGPEAVLSHVTAARLWGLIQGGDHRPHISVPGPGGRRRLSVVAHRRRLEASETTRRLGIPVTTPACTLIDLACNLPRSRLEAAVNAADKLDLVDPETLREVVDVHRGRRGVAILRSLLDRRTFALTDSELERRFLRIVESLSLPVPQTGRLLNGFKVDFFWPGLGLVVETDGLRYHRTPAQQARDRLRDQAHAAAGLTCLRFTHAQVRCEPAHVVATLAAVAERLTASAGGAAVRSAARAGR